jgi:enoyl-CoA hydratase
MSVSPTGGSDAEQAGAGDEVVRYEVDGHVATITLNRPKQRNAVSPELATALGAAVTRFEQDPEVWVAVLTGAGGIFSAGADLKAIAAGRAAELSVEPGGFAGYVRYPRTKPVIAAVRGFALAGGTELVLASDLVVAATDSAFGLPEVTRGIVAAAGGLFRLPRVLPRARALELIATGDRLPAEEALRFGMINAVVEPDDVLTTARALADRICANAPLAVRESLTLARRAAELTEDEAWRLSGEARDRISRTEDAAEGPRAFAEKRPATWKGR